MIGTVYALVDPRDGQTRYVGATTRALRDRLSGHLNRSASAKVREWVGELRAVNAQPTIVPIAEDVPVADLFDAEREEISRCVLGGIPLLNISSTARPRAILEQAARESRERECQVAWAYLADVVRDAVGGPLPPGVVRPVAISDELWEYISTGGDTRKIRTEEWSWRESFRSEFRRVTRDAWSCVSGLGQSLDFHLNTLPDTILRQPWSNRESFSRFLALVPWAVSAVTPWYQLARAGGLAATDEAFTEWVVGDDAMRESLTYLTPHLKKVCADTRPARDLLAPHVILAALGAAYQGVRPPEVIARDLLITLEVIASDDQLTESLADLLLELNPDALASVYGRDILTKIDTDLSLTEGTALLVAQQILERTPADWKPLVRAIHRGSGKFPTVNVPYDDWDGIGASFPVMFAPFIRSGLMQLPSWCSTVGEYLTKVRSRWTPARSTS